MSIKSTKVTIRFESVENTSVDSAEGKLPITLEKVLDFVNGTTNGLQADLVYVKKYTAQAGAQTLDLIGSLTSRLTGAAQSYIDMVGVVVFNEEALGAGKTITVGGGSAPFVGMWAASGDAAVIGPQGAFVWLSPDGSAPVATTGDILTMTPSAAATWYVAILGRSA